MTQEYSMQTYVISKTSEQSSGISYHAAHPFFDESDINKRRKMGLFTGRSEIVTVLRNVCPETYQTKLKPAIQRANRGEKVDFKGILG